MKNKTLTAEYGSDKTPLILGSVEVPCYVLSNGQRVLSGNGMQKALGYSGSSGDWLIRFLNNKSLSPHLNAGVLDTLSSRVEFIRPGAGGSVSNTYGYDATVLIDICDAILTAKNAGDLTPKQLIYAVYAETIIRAVAKVGIVALIDEVTGYQKARSEDALQKFLQKFLEDEKAKWIRTFPPDFFEAIFKMKGWDWNIANEGKKPQVVGHYINNYVYSRIAPKVLNELRERNPKNEKGNRKGKYPQWINPEYGHPILKERLNTLTAFARAAGYNWNTWDRMVKRAFPKFEDDGSQVLELPFDE